MVTDSGRTRPGTVGAVKLGAVAVAVIVLAGGAGAAADASVAPVSSPPSSQTSNKPSPGEAGAGAAGVGDELYPDLGNGGYEVTHYDLALAPGPSGTLTGTTTIDAAATAGLTSFHLDLVGM